MYKFSKNLENILKILGSRRQPWKKFHTVGPQMIFVKLHDLLAQAFWRPESVHPTVKLSILLLQSLRRSHKINNETETNLESRKFINFRWQCMSTEHIIFFYVCSVAAHRHILESTFFPPITHCDSKLTIEITNQTQLNIYCFQNLTSTTTCFEPKIILREQRCSLLKSF